MNGIMGLLLIQKKLREFMLLSLLIGGTILGPLGMLFAVPATGVMKVILTEIAFVRKNAHLL